MDLHRRCRQLGLVCLVGFGWLIASEAARGFDAPPETRAFVLHVVEEGTGAPIEGAAVNARSGDAKAEGRTDEKGVCSLDVPTSPSVSFQVFVSKDGFTSIRFEWRDEGEGKVAASIPAEHTVSLSKGTTIGGLVQDEEGAPIAGASVFVSIEISVDKLPEAGTPWPNVRGFEVKTDAEGRWRCDVVPAKLDDLVLRLRHPDFADDSLYGSSTPSVEQLRDQTSVMVMKKGITVEGRVLAADGKAVAGAKVAQGASRFVSPAYPTATTDDEGKFRFAHRQPGEMILTVQAKGHAPDLRRIVVAPDLAPVDFSLEPARRIRGRLVDSQGKPVAGAFVVADTWRGYRSIEFRVDTDQDGRFAWNDAPADDVRFDIGKQGYMSVRRKVLKASEDDATITLMKPLKVSGGVVDDETGEPVGAFTVTPGIDWGSGRPPTWERQAARRGANGRYEIAFSEPREGHFVRIEADGHLPTVSRSFQDDEGDVAFDVRLKRGEGVSGVVVGPDGKPVAGASVCLVLPGAGARIANGRLPNNQRDAALTETDQDGRFHFPAQDGKFALVVLSDDGFAILTGDELAASNEVKLKAWGRVEGVVRVGAKPASGESVRLTVNQATNRDDPQAYFDYNATTDDDGRYVIERVPPGEVSVVREIKLSDRSTAYSHATPVVVDPGQTARVDIGGTGRPVIGRAITPGVSNENRIFQLNSLRPSSSNNLLLELAKRLKAPDKPAAGPRPPSSYAVKIETNGSFRVDDVPAGEYDLNIRAYEPAADEYRAIGDQLGSVTHKVVVPEMPGGRSDEPLDLGAIELTMYKQVKVGDAAPGFQAAGLDGGTIKLEDFRGKFVLLDFWATWCGPCLGETPHLKAAHEAFGKDDRLAMIGLSLDQNEDAPRKYVEKNALGWRQAFLGSFDETKVPTEYGVFGIPSIWLIGPDGKVVAKDLRGAAIKEAIAKALGKGK